MDKDWVPGSWGLGCNTNRESDSEWWGHPSPDLSPPMGKRRATAHQATKSGVSPALENGIFGFELFSVKQIRTQSKVDHICKWVQLVIPYYKSYKAHRGYEGIPEPSLKLSFYLPGDAGVRCCEGLASSPAQGRWGIYFLAFLLLSLWLYCHNPGPNLILSLDMPSDQSDLGLRTPGWVRRQVLKLEQLLRGWG